MVFQEAPVQLDHQVRTEDPVVTVHLVSLAIRVRQVGTESPDQLDSRETQVFQALAVQVHLVYLG